MVARSPREAGQAKQAEPQHCGAPLETFHHLACRFQHGGGALSRISNFGDKPKPCLPTPGDSICWTLTPPCIGARLLGLVGFWGKAPRARAGLQWGETRVSWGQDEIMERMWSNGPCHSFIQQTFTEPWWCARFGLKSGDKDESGMVPPSKNVYPAPTPIRWLLRTCFNSQLWTVRRTG